MSYTKLTDFAAKDALLSGNPSKLLRGTEIGAEFAALETADALNAKTGTGVSFSSITDTGNLDFTGTANRIKGDFSNATVANRVMFQTSTVNGATAVTCIPNGSGAESRITLLTNPDPTIASGFDLRSLTTEVMLRANNYGGGFLPMTFCTGGSERMRIDTSGNVTVTSAGGLGYGTGAGGTVTQATSKSTAVTLNKHTGGITMTADSMVAGAVVSFQVNNSLVNASDCVLLTCPYITVDPEYYRVEVNYASNGSFTIRVTNISAGSRADALQINFAIIKGSPA